MKRLIIKEGEGKKEKWVCVARMHGCYHIRNGHPTISWVLKHAVSCRSLRENDNSLWRDANSASSNQALGAKMDPAKENDGGSDPLHGQQKLNLAPFRAGTAKMRQEQQKALQDGA